MARLGRTALRSERPLILMYHRIAECPHDPWDLAVSPTNFGHQLDLLRRKRTIVPLSWLVERIDQGRNANHSVAITFDDGYRDLLTNAKPLLLRHGAPATVFVPGGLVGKVSGFWWDTLTRIFLGTPTLPDRLTIDRAGQTSSWAVSGEAEARRDVHDAVWAQFKAMTQRERSQQLTQLCAWARISIEAPLADRCMTEAELAEFIQPGLLDLGAHTMTHPSLPFLSADEQHEEIRNSLAWITTTLGIQPIGLAYPFGDCDAATRDTARTAGARFAFTTASGPIRRGMDVLALPRVPATNLDAEAFGQSLDCNA
jgi:peptidoglycan/xylan/chitin deacetylase (PgdA/CDA1 family)